MVLIIVFFFKSADPLTLPEAIAEIKELFDFEAIQAEIREWIDSDPEVAAVYDYFSSDNFEAGWVAVSANAEISGLVRWIESTGVDIIGRLNSIAERFGLPPFEPRPTPVKFVEARSWPDFVEAILVLYPQEEFRAKIAELNAAGGEFAELFSRIDALRPTFQAIEASEEAQTIGADLRALGVNVDRLIELFKQTFGWE